MGIETIGKLHTIFETKQVSERFTKREFVIELADNPKYPQVVLFQLTGDRCSQLDGMRVGDEVRIEMRVPAQNRSKVESALLRVHPYEEPAYDFFRVEAPPASLGRMGSLPEPLPFGELRAFVDRALGSRCELFGKLDRKVSKIAVVGGAGGDYWLRAKAAGCDALVTGECAHHQGRDAAEVGFAIVEAGHYHTEHPGMVALCDRLRVAMPEASFDVYEPVKGRCGRPD
jgi:putative NIF3 family GTP cyclohydrolase 1 type 2